MSFFIRTRQLPQAFGLFTKRTISSATSASLATGEQCYSQAKEYILRHQKALELKESANHEHQYDKSKSGLQVVKKIVNQARREQKETLNVQIDFTKGKKSTHINTSNGKNENRNDAEENNLEKAREFMQLAAYLHGYNDAIISLANDALSKHVFDAKEEYKYIFQSDSTDNLIVDMDEIQECSQRGGAHVARKLYELAGERGSKEAWFNLGHLLWTGHDLGNEQSIEPDQSLAMNCFEKAVSLGDDDARYFLAVCYLGEQDEGVDDEIVMDLRRNGLKLVQEAADNGHVGALYYLALLYRNGDAGLEIEPCLNLFMEYLDEAADDGDGDALFLRAYCLFHGEDGYESDIRKALDGFLAAGEEGNSDGLVSAGALYHRGGYDIKKDQRMAFELYQEAGEMGNLEGWRNVVACYALGEGVPRCEKTASHIQKTILDSSIHHE